MWKDFFYFTRNERRGTIILIILIIITVTVGVLVPIFKKPPTLADNNNTREKYDKFIASIKENDSINRVKTEYYRPRNENKGELFLFDPNKADSAVFSKLGLQPFVIKNILLYRKKGGNFKKAESFKKIYGLTSHEYERLLPYISIPEIMDEKPNTVTPDTFTFNTQKPIYEKKHKYPHGTIVNLNTADTLELKKIPGIGSRIAKGIVYYRDKLGGFYDVKQLQDLQYIPDSLNKWFYVDDSPIKKLKANASSIEHLKSHPYINFYQSKVIVEYRKKKGKIKSIEQLALYEEFTADDLERLKHYLSFD